MEEALAGWGVGLEDRGWLGDGGCRLGVSLALILSWVDDARAGVPGKFASSLPRAGTHIVSLYPHYRGGISLGDTCSHPG